MIIFFICGKQTGKSKDDDFNFQNPQSKKVLKISVALYFIVRVPCR